MIKGGNKVTINDVAKAAGVSKGTVDRVLHNRGEVSRKSKEKVLKVIEELGFKPNLYASLLASQKDHVIACLIPEYAPGEFWSLAEKGINEGAGLVARYGIRVEVVKYDQYSVESFRDACCKVLEINPSGVILPPMFADETARFVSELSEKNIPYVYVDSKIDDDRYLAYFGMPMYESGCLCAYMLSGGRSVPEHVYAVRIARDKEGLSDPTAARRKGFSDFMSGNYPDTKVTNVFIDPKDPESIMARLDSTIGSGQGERFVVMFNSRIHIVADYLEERKIGGCRVIGFDCLEKNLEALKKGYVDALIAQHTDMQAVNAVNVLADYIILGTPPVRKDNYTQMDILNIYNCDYYL